VDTTSQHPRADLVASALWLVLGLLTLQQSWAMDRLEGQGADPWSVPGLVPGIIGVVLTILGLALLVRSLRTTRLAAGSQAEEDMEVRQARHRLLITLALCLLFAFGLLGHGLPFWLAAALFISAFIVLFTWRERRAAGLLARGVAVAVAYGLVAGVAIHLLFQDVFLVRLP
jgi:uncharacterized membrane protein